MNAPLEAGLDPCVLASVRDGVRTITMNRGDRFNGLSTAMIAALDAALDRAMQHKPKGHDFMLDRDHAGPALNRHMSVTGG